MQDRNRGFDDLVARQAKLTVRQARNLLERARRGEIDSVLPLCDAARGLRHAVESISGTARGGELAREARALLEELEHLCRALARYVPLEARRLQEHDD